MNALRPVGVSTMRALFCATGLLVSFACAKGEESHPAQTLAILFRFEQPYVDRALTEAERELNMLTRGAGVKLEWHDRGNAHPGVSFPNILVLDFLGNCDPRSETKYAGPVDGWLARMHISDGVVLPFGEVNCDMVRVMLRDDAGKAMPSAVVFGRALARVLAHELYHFITNTTEHSAEGLAKPSFSRKDLAMDGLKLNRYELHRLAKTILP
jgi:hypothetical protein